MRGANIYISLSNELREGRMEALVRKGREEGCFKIGDDTRWQYSRLGIRRWNGRPIQ